MGNHTNFKGMFNKERIENLEKRISRIEQIQNAECNSTQMERRVQRALIDSNNEVVRRIFDDVSVNSVYGVDVFSPKTGDIRVRNAVFSGEVFKQAAPNGIHDYLKKVEEDKTEAPTIASVLEKAKKNTMAIQELLKRTRCSNVNEVISKFELGVSFKKMYDEEASKRKELAIQRDRLESEMMRQIEDLKSRRDELLTATGCANFSDLKNKFLCKDIKRDELIGSICGESDAVVRYLDLKKRYEDLEKKKKTLLDSVRELQKQVYDVSRDKKYLEIANTSLLQETRKTKGVLNEKIKKLRQRLKQSSIRYRDLKESIPHNGLKSV